MLDYNKITADINDINGNYWIKANAGCGKTTKLVGRFLFLLKNGTKPEDIVCITYTNAGAKEMKDRVINELLILQQRNKAQQVRNINYNSLQIDTIHGFCQKFLIKQKILPENVKIISSNIHEKNRIVRQIIQSISNAKYLENDVYNITKSISYDEFCQIINDVIEKQNNFRELCEEVFDTDIENNDIQNHKDLSFLLPEEIRHLKNINLSNITTIGNRSFYHIANDINSDTSFKLITYQLTRNDSVLYNYIDSGHYEILVTQDEQHDGDGFYRIGNKGYWLCLESEHEEEIQDISTNSESNESIVSHKIVYDNDKIYLGLGASEFTAMFYDENGNAIDGEAEWVISCDFQDKMDIDYINNTIVIGVNDYSLLNKSFELYFNDDEATKIKVQIVGLI